MRTWCGYIGFLWTSLESELDRRVQWANDLRRNLLKAQPLNIHAIEFCQHITLKNLNFASVCGTALINSLDRNLVESPARPLWIRLLGEQNSNLPKAKINLIARAPHSNAPSRRANWQLTPNFLSTGWAGTE